MDTLINASSPIVRLYLQLLKDTGARCSEASRLTWNDIHLPRKQVKITASKHSRNRTLKLSDKTVDMLQVFPRHSTRKTLFVSANSMRCNFNNQRKHIASSLGNPRFLQISFHTFCHWKGTMLYHDTKDIMHVKQILGHRSVTNTEIYISMEKELFHDAKKDQWIGAVANTKEEALSLIEANFEFVVDFDNVKLFRKRK